MLWAFGLNIRSNGWNFFVNCGGVCEELEVKILIYG